ncbi:MAG: hypothetical protein COA94_04160 [Rickettsiales bacterium]|nr:MAG: hypothetical protein COA94_04160 [Rickettsiales bacterium]
MSKAVSENNFQFATSLIKIIAIVISLMVIVVSWYAFIFFIGTMLPTIFAIFYDRNRHRCLSATVCSFNLIGVLPYMIRIWESSSVDYLAKQLLTNIDTWMMIYGTAFIGQLLYVSMPVLIVKLYEAKTKVHISNYQNQHKELCAKWDLDGC